MRPATRTRRSGTTTFTSRWPCCSSGGFTTVREKDAYRVIHRPMGPAARLVCPVLPWLHGRRVAVWGSVDGVATRPPVASGSKGSRGLIGGRRLRRGLRRPEPGIGRTEITAFERLFFDSQAQPAGFSVVGSAGWNAGAVGLAARRRAAQRGPTSHCAYTSAVRQ